MALSSGSSYTLLIAIVLITLLYKGVLITIKEFLIEDISFDNIFTLKGLDRDVYLIAR